MTPPVATPAKPSHESIDLIALRPEQLFSAIFEQVAVGIALIETATGRFIQVNQHYCDIVGLSKAQLLATTVMAITHPDDLQPDLDHMEKLRAGQIQDFLMEQRYYRADGTVVWVELTVSPLRGLETSSRYHIAVVQDITERKRIDEQARRWSQVFTASHLGWANVSIADNIFLDVNAAFAQKRGYRVEELIGKPVLTLYPPEVHQSVKARIQEIDRSGHLIFETVHQCKDGTTIPVLLEITVIKDAQGRPLSRVVYALDITEQKQGEQVLRDRDQQLQISLEASHAGTWCWDFGCDNMVWDHRFHALYGFGPDETPSYETWRTRVHPNDLPQVEAHLHALRQSSSTKSCHQEFRIVHPLKGELWIEGRGEIERDAAGYPISLAGINLDITGRKQAEQALRESEERFRHLFEHAGTGIAITDMQGRFLHCNPAYCALFGYSEAELSDMTFQMLVHPDDLNTNMVEAGRLISQEIPYLEIENRSRHKDGHEVWVHKFASMLRDEAGYPKYLFALVTDITEQRRAQELLEQRVAERTAALCESEERLRLAQAAAKLGTFDWDILEGTVKWSSQLEEIWGVPIGKFGSSYDAWVQLIHPEDRTEAEQLVRQALEDPEHPYVLEHRIVRLDGVERWIAAHGTIIRDETGRPMRMVGINMDITDRKRSEAMQEGDKDILELIASGAALSKVLERVCRLCEDMSPGLLASILLLDEDQLRLHHGAAPSLPAAYCAAIDGVRIGPNVGSCGTAAYLKRQVIVTDVATDPLWMEYRELALKHHLRACWSTPIVSKEGAVLGTFAMYYREPRNPGAQDFQLKEQATKLAAIAIERKRAEDALRTSEERFAFAVEGTQDGIWDWDVHAKTFYHSSRWNALLGLKTQASRSPEEAFFTRLHPDDVTLLQQAIQAHFEKRVPYNVEVRLRHENGSYRWFRATGQAIWDEQGCPYRMVGSLSDITERRQAVEALQDAYHRLQFLTREIHVAQEQERIRLSRELHDEFGQLLSGLKFKFGSINGMLSEKPVRPTAIVKQVKEAHATVDRLFRSLREMVTALRPAVLEALGLVAALQSMADDIQEATGIVCRISTKVEPVQSHIGKELEGTLYRIAQELLTNVMRHAKATQAHITLCHADGMIVLVIQDNGRGVDVYQAKRKNRLGLLGVQERAELLGGTLTIDSTPKVGTTATVRIPIELPLSPASQMNLDRLPRSRSPRKRPRRGH